MSSVITFSTDDVKPRKDAVFQNQGISAGQAVSSDIEALHDRAVRCCLEVASPVGVWAELSKAEFAEIYEGEGLNEPSTPVGDVFPRADCLALFAATLGKDMGRRIAEGFSANDFAFAGMLDAVASAAADRMVAVLEDRFLESFPRGRKPVNRAAVLAYSPGYCGWDISGQAKLFESLDPTRIGITLRESFLMEPLKSVSGVLVAGSMEIHDVASTYSFCDRCETRGCRDRIRALKARGTHCGFAES